MKLKNSNKISYFLLLALIVLVVGLVIYSGEKFDISESSNKNELKDYTRIKQATTLNFIEITLSEKNYNKLKKYRNRALSVGVISAKDKKYVPATITFNGKDYKADIRLKGDWTDHLKGDKWSFRIKLKGNKTILGMRKFSIHHPITRGYINEWLFHKATKAEKLIGLRYGFVEGGLHIKNEGKSSVTNKNLGIYAIEETFDKRMLENNGRKESIILKFSEENWWSNVKKRIEVGKESGIKWDNFTNYKSGSWKFPITVFSERKVLEDPIMHNYFKLSKNILEKLRNKDLSINEVFSVKQLAMHSALTNLFGAQHGIVIINFRFFYNPITSKLEPISFDGNSGQLITKYHHFMFTKKQRDTLYYRELINALEKVSKKEYVTHLLKESNKELNYFNIILEKEFGYNKVGVKRKALLENQEIIREELAILKKQFQDKDIENQEIKEELITNNEHSKWKFTNTVLTPQNKEFRNYKVFKFSRKETAKSAYTITKYITADFKEEYTVSFLVKTAANKSDFAIRIQGEYPNRVDAVFNLDIGEVKGVEKTGTFTNGKATIKKMENGWYLCTLKTRQNTTTFKIIIGSANNATETANWESKSTINNEVYIALKE